MHVYLFQALVFVGAMLVADARLPPRVVRFENKLKSEVRKLGLPNLVHDLFSQHETMEGLKDIDRLSKLLSLDQGGLGKFSWKNCGKPDDLLLLKSLSIAPDPVVLPGTLSIGFAFDIFKTFTSPLAASVILQKKIGSKFFTVPCVGEFGSCNYTDFCSILNPIAECPKEFTERGIPCKCPFTQGNYSLPDITFNLDAIPLPKGDYHAKIDASYLGKHVGCVEVYLTVASEFTGV